MSAPTGNTAMNSLATSNPDTLPAQDWRLRLREWLRRWRRYGYMPLRGVITGALLAAAAAGSASAYAHERAVRLANSDSLDESNQQIENVALGYIASHGVAMSY